MGLFSFVKNAGAKLLGKETDKERAAAAAADAAEARQRAAMQKAKMERALDDHVKGLGFDVDNASYSYDSSSSRVTIRGTVDSQELAEKVVLAVGNVEGVESVDNRLDVKNPEAEARFYTVERGDTLSKIAKEHYGNASKYPVIFEANKPMLKDPDKIYPGQVLRIPPQN